MTERILLNIDAGVAEVRLNRPEKMNAIDPAMFEALVATGERLMHEADLRAVVLSGEGRAFCAGLDMASMASLGQGSADSAVGGGRLAKRTHGSANLPQYACTVWRELPVPVIAAGRPGGEAAADAGEAWLPLSGGRWALARRRNTSTSYTEV